MRRILIASLFLAGSAMAITSCNNGAYDAHPNQDLSEAKNPLDPSSPVSVYLGSIESVVDREKVLFINAHYSLVEVVLPNEEKIVTRIITAEAKNDPMFKTNIYAAINEDTYQNLNDGGYPKAGGWQFEYRVADTSIDNRLLFHKYMAGTEAGYLDFTVIAQDGPHMRGKFSGVLYRAILAEDGVTPTGDFDMSDSVVINKAEFYLPKQ